MLSNSHKEESKNGVSRVLSRQIERNAALDVFAKLQVAKEAHRRVEAGDDYHARVQDARPPYEVPRRLHLVLQR